MTMNMDMGKTNKCDEKKDVQEEEKFSSMLKSLDCTETDLLLHIFLQRDQSPSVKKNPIEKTDLSNDVLNNQQKNHFEPDGTGITPAINPVLNAKTTDRPVDFIQANSPMQNLTLRGSLDNMSHHEKIKMENFQFPSAGVQANQEAAHSQLYNVAMQLAASENTASSAGVPAGYAAMNPGVESLNPGYFANNTSQTQMAQQQSQPTLGTFSQDFVTPNPVYHNFQQQPGPNVASIQEELYKKMVRCVLQLNQLQRKYVVSLVQQSTQIKQSPRPIIIEYPIYQLAWNRDLIFPEYTD